MSSRHVLLSLKGLFCLALQQEGGTEKEPTKRDLFESLRFICSTCYIARDSYWEHVAHYPTTNLHEIYKIVQAEIAHISPVDGQTNAFIVNSSSNKTIVLYCCFPEEIIITAKSYNLWRLLPETLPYYRYFYGETGVYSSTLNLSELSTNTDNNHTVVGDGSLYSELLIKNDADMFSSLPVNSDNLDMYSIAMREEATVITCNEKLKIFHKFNRLDVIDFIVQAIGGVKGIVSKNGYVARYITIAFIAFMLTFIVGKSAYTTWHYSYLTEKIAEAKSSAVGALKLSNELKIIKRDIIKINTSVTSQVSRFHLLNVLSDLIDKDNDLKYSIVDILSGEMQLRGTVKNSANLLMAIANINGFSQVEFSRPPVNIKEGGERFFINLHFDERVMQDQVGAIDKELVNE